MLQTNVLEFNGTIFPDDEKILTEYYCCSAPNMLYCFLRATQNFT